jgi:hypothetical protein
MTPQDVLDPVQGPLAEPEPEAGSRGPRRCERCGAITGLLIFVPGREGRGGGRFCQDCLRILDRLRGAPPASRG